MKKKIVEKKENKFTVIGGGDPEVCLLKSIEVMPGNNYTRYVNISTEAPLFIEVIIFNTTNLEVGNCTYHCRLNDEFVPVKYHKNGKPTVQIDFGVNETKHKIELIYLDKDNCEKSKITNLIFIMNNISLDCTPTN